MAQVQNNFLIWGAWSQLTIGHPFLTKRLRGDVKDIVVGPACMVALMQNGDVYSWGKDPYGLMGQGERTEVSAPTKIAGISSPVISVSMGTCHVLALTSAGEVYAWGVNDKGQLGLGEDKMERALSPEYVNISDKVVQVVANKFSSYALTVEGKVYAWGSNDKFALGHGENVDECDYHYGPTHVEIMNTYKSQAGTSSAEELFVRRLEAQGTVMVAYVDNGPRGPPGYDTTYTSPLDEGGSVGAEPTGEDASIYTGVTKMREVMESLRRWWKANDRLQHGSPYPCAGVKGSNEASGSIEQDMSVNMAKLEEVAQALESSAHVAEREIATMKKQQGTKNMRFLMELYLDDCLLRREKVDRTLCARKLVTAKRDAEKVAGQMVCTFEKGSVEMIQKITAMNSTLQSAQKEVSKVGCHDILTKELQCSILHSLNGRLERNDFQIEMAKLTAHNPADIALPALRVIKDRWLNLKAFSLFDMYQQYEKRKSEFGDDTGFLRFLVNSADMQIDQVIQTDKDAAISRDALIPTLCYDLLLENAELRKMANAYQLRVLMLHKGGR